MAIKLSDEYIENIKTTLPELPESRKKKIFRRIQINRKRCQFNYSFKIFI